MPPSTAAPDAPQATPPAGSQAQAIAQYLDQMTGLYAASYRRAAAAMDGAAPEAIQACASSAFIACQRKFSL